MMSFCLSWLGFVFSMMWWVKERFVRGEISLEQFREMSEEIRESILVGVDKEITSGVSVIPAKAGIHKARNVDSRSSLE